MKRLILPFLILIIAGLVLAVGWLLAGGRPNLDVPAVTEQSRVSAHTVLKEVLPIGEYASLAYRYTSVIKDVNTKDIKGWNIPFTTRKYIFTYDGVMKLGIDCAGIGIEEAAAENPAENSGGSPDAGRLPVIRITLPPIRILSHEIIDDSVEVFEQSQTIFNEIKIEDAFKVTAERKLEMEHKVMEGGAADEARRSLEQQFAALFRGLPGIRDAYVLEFVWALP